MPYLRFGLVAINALAFIALFALTIRFLAREQSARVRRLWLVVALASGALIVGSVQRLILQASALDWLPGSAARGIVEEWQLVQSLVVVMLAIAGFTVVKRLADSMAASERIAATILDRVDHVDVESLDLTPREEEVLAAIGRGVLTDAELADALHISKNTVQTHVKRLLRKTGLSRRQDLLAVAYLVEKIRT